jgi:hypothetical protein
METLILQIPEELANRIKPYRHQLTHVLELGLAHINTPISETGREKTLQALLATGLIQPLSLELVTRYKANQKRRRRSHLKISGVPLSQTIIEQRGKL